MNDDGYFQHGGQATIDAKLRAEREVEDLATRLRECQDHLRDELKVREKKSEVPDPPPPRGTLVDAAEDLRSAWQKGLAETLSAMKEVFPQRESKGSKRRSKKK